MSYAIWCAVTFLAGYMLNVLYITVFYHRGLTHGAVVLSPLTRKLVIKTGSWVTGLDPKGWSVMHRMHHAYSDTERDPHSPRQFGIVGVMMAQLNSYNRVLRGLMRKESAYTSVAPDLDFPVNYLNRKKLWLLPYMLHLAIWLVIGAVFDAWMLGYCYFAGIMSHPIQGWLVNALGHTYGYRNFDSDDDSRNNTFVALFVAGEGYQNNHHRYPSSAKFSVKRSEIDWGYGLCVVLQSLGALKIAGVGHEDEEDVRGAVVV